MRFLLFIGIFAVLFSCNKKIQERNHVFQNTIDSVEGVSEQAEQYEAPIQNPLKTHKLKLLITNNTNTFFLYKGESMGLEFELLKLFLDEEKINAEIILIDNLRYIRDSLHTKGAHIAASTFILPNQPSPSVLYSNAIYNTNLVLVKNKNHTSAIKNVTLIYDAPYVRYLLQNNSSSLSELEVLYTKEPTTKELLLEKVHRNEIESTIVDEHEALIMIAMYPDLVIEKVVEQNAPVAFMFHSKMDALRNEFNTWLAKHKKTSDYAWILKKYTLLPKHISEMKKKSQDFSIGELTSVISEYDDLIKKYSSTIDWDWRLVASLIHQESHFNPKLKSWVGACGLMQVMPKTAKAYANVSEKQIFVPRSNIIAGTAYLHWLESNFFSDSSIATSEKQKFIIASYNAGPGHIADARALCRKYKLNPNIWDDNVEKMILAKCQPKYYKDPVCKHGYCRGYETTTYVNNILTYFGRYSNYF